MKNKQMLFIYNPNAGRGTFKQKLSDVIDLFVKGGYEVVVRPTQARLDAYQSVKEFRYPYDIVGCCGGDGTLDEVVKGMITRTDRIPIGYIPAGTVNDFASSLHIPKQTIKAAQQIAEVLEKNKVLPKQTVENNDFLKEYQKQKGHLPGVLGKEKK